MAYDNKIAIIIKNDLKDWQKLNIVSFLGGSVAIQFPELHGKPFVNASGSTYLPFINQPMMIYAANSDEEIKRAFNRAKDRGLAIGIYTESLFLTKNEGENHAEIAKCSDEDQVLVGIIIYGESKKVKKALDGLKFHT